IIDELTRAFKTQGTEVNWYVMDDFLKPEAAVEKLVQPFLGAEDTVWGTKTSLQLADFYQMDALAALKPDTDFPINILIVTGAALSGWEAAAIYIDLPMNELHHRMNAGSITCLGKSAPEKSAAMYK